MKEIGINEGPKPAIQIPPAAINLPITLAAGVVGQAVCHPLLNVKVRMQMQSEAIDVKSIRSVFRNMYANEGGISAFYRGVDAGCLRQAVFSPVRMGAFYWMSELIRSQKDPNNSKLSMSEKTICSGITGFLGAIACSPFDLAYVRLQADRGLPKELRSNYRNAIDAVVTTVKEEGVRGLFKGVTPSIVRCSLLNVVMMVSFEESKDRLRPFLGNNKWTVLVSSAVSGSLTAFCSLPFDNAKVKLQKQKKLPDGSLQYKGMVDCMMQSIQREGLKGLWSGLRVYMFSIASLSFLILIITEYLRKRAGLIV